MDFCFVAFVTNVAYIAGPFTYESTSSVLEWYRSTLLKTSDLAIDTRAVIALSS